MRIPPLVLSLLLLANAAFAQGLEYRMRMHMNMPGMPEGSMPAPETTMYVEGENVRIDSGTRGFSMSMIMNAARQRVVMLNHNEKTYHEDDRFGKTGNDFPKDTAAMRAMGMVPEVIPTTEKRTILGYTAERVVMVMRIPNSAEPGTTMLSINESWIATDPRMKEAFKSLIDIAERMSGAAAKDMRALMPSGAEGVPLETNILMLKRAASDKIDALAILKDPNPAGLMTRARMETISVQLKDIPDSLFAVPADYRKQN